MVCFPLDFVDALDVSDNAPTTISSAQNQETATDTEGVGSPTGKLALQSFYNGLLQNTLKHNVGMSADGKSGRQQVS